MNAESLILFFLTGAFLVGIAIAVSRWASPRSWNPQKGETYECGIPTSGVSWLQFNIGYYLFAILFLIFDVETVFLFPWAVVMRDLGMVAFVEILVFLIILGLGLLYAWKKKALIWQ
jgi:NADH-quinone oxidoreductase subunit A